MAATNRRNKIVRRNPIQDRAVRRDQVSDSSEIEKMVEEVLANNQKMIEDYKAADEGRKPRVLKGIVGQVMKLSKGKANPEIVNELIMSKLN